MPTVTDPSKRPVSGVKTADESSVLCGWNIRTGDRQNGMRADEGCKALVLDWNGTVVNDTARATAATNHVLTQHGLPPLTTKQFRQRFSLPLREFFARLGVTTDRMNDAIEQWNAALIGDGPQPQPGAWDLLEWCHQRRVPVIVLSGAHTDVIAHDAKYLNLTRWLSMVIAPSHDKASDLRRLSDDLGAEIVFVGDTDYDMDAARAAGVRGIAFSGGYHHPRRLQATQPDRMVDDLRLVIRELAVGSAFTV
ncbi:HAD family hydrolase [Mycolicibacterium arenosum]|uniref:HAD family hydrolase n=1 Tax=Mycolicibacterium arenosum TaxID=2952157 RepID=A0ABT1MBL3_9MYCO|nr:HAD family hydrolase [Mycolicibacterium sp. CAU 1645]MCP9276564.1 HAD family hydrolase [Mycolicibacterium sp. CAU 1645]